MFDLELLVQRLTGQQTALTATQVCEGGTHHSWAASLLEAADRLALAYPVLVELLRPCDDLQSLTRLARTRAELAQILAELSRRYTPESARLLKCRTLEPLASVREKRYPTTATTPVQDDKNEVSYVDF